MNEMESKEESLEDLAIYSCFQSFEDNAVQKYGDIDVFSAKFRPLRATLSGLPDLVLMKHIVCAKTNVVLGAHMCGEDSPEIIQGIAIAVKAGLTKEDFDATVGIHPTSAEGFVTMRTSTRKMRRNDKSEGVHTPIWKS